MKSLFKQCAFAALTAAALNASVSMAQDTNSGIGAQLDRLGFSRTEVHSKLDGMPASERLAYLQSLGVQVPQGAVRLVAGAGLKISGASQTAIEMDAPVGNVASSAGNRTFARRTADGNINGTLQPLPSGSVSIGAIAINPTVHGSGLGAASSPSSK